MQPQTETQYPDFRFCVCTAIFIGFLLLAAIILSGCSASAVAIPMTGAVAVPNIGVGAVGTGGVAKVSAIDQAIELERIMLADVAHAEDRHGPGIVDMADQCLKSKGAIATMANPGTKRKALICALSDKLFIVEILEEGGDLVTTFIKEKMNCLEKVVKYLGNGGYQ